MWLDRVTITGAYDLVDPGDLAGLSREFPFVEWGILLSRKKSGVPKFPCRHWIDELAALADSHRFALAGHLCGDWARQIAMQGRADVFRERPELLRYFPRIQINCQPSHPSPLFNNALSPFENEFIFQLGSASMAAETDLRALRRATQLNVSILFDASGGNGVVPAEWPKPIEHFRVGYAGGLGPATLPGQLPKISQVVGDRTVWIDMEANVRSDGGRRFDLAKVRTCLEAARAWVW
jgi:hypothetical protein